MLLVCFLIRIMTVINFSQAQKVVDKIRNERDKLDHLLQQHSKRNDSYFEMIESLQKQKNEVNL